MKKNWHLPLLCLVITLFACKDIPEFISNVINVKVDLTASPTDLDELSIDLKQVSIKGEAITADISYTETAGIYNLTNWTDQSFEVAQFLIDYDSISYVRITLGDENSIVNNMGTHDLPLITGHDGIVTLPYDKYIQETPDVSIQLEFQSAASIVELDDGSYALDPKFIITN